jgi:ABC-type lipoprotein export system ATPase subunit
MNNLLILKNLSKTFYNNKKIKVLKNLSFNFSSGKIYSLMGPSGSGKSTLLNLLSLIDTPSSGSIKIENKEISSNNSIKNDILRANKIGIVYQQNNLLPDFTSLENIYLAHLAINNNKTLAITKSKKLLKKIGLLNRENHYSSELSGGEMQRIAIARAIINEPQIILADEPTGSLDLETAKNIFNLLKKQINSKRLIIFATHNRFFANQADCMLEMVNGNIRTINDQVKK